jgi:hypothetical protein
MGRLDFRRGSVFRRSSTVVTRQRYGWEIGVIMVLFIKSNVFDPVFIDIYPAGICGGLHHVPDVATTSTGSRSVRSWFTTLGL